MKRYSRNSTPHTPPPTLLLLYYYFERNNSMRDLCALNSVCNRYLRLFEAERRISHHRLGLWLCYLYARMEDVYTAVSRKVVLEKRKSERDNVESYG